MHRNKYMEGARRVRERPMLTMRTVWLLIALSVAGYAVFWYFVADINDDAGDATGIARQMGDAILLIGVVVLAGAACGALIGLLRRRSAPSDLMTRFSQDAPSSGPGDAKSDLSEEKN